MEESPQLDYTVERVAPDSLTPHPRNYRTHSEPQLDHLVQSISDYGFYRNVVVAEDGTILAGHGVVLAARRMGLPEIPVVRLAIAADSPEAMKVIVGDNEIARLAFTNEDTLREILADIRDESAEGLLGTGFDEGMFARMIASEGKPEHDTAAAEAEWEGMPEYESKEHRVIYVHFVSEEDVAKFAAAVGQEIEPHTKYIWYPYKDRADCESLRFDTEDAEKAPYAEDNGA